MNMTNMRKSRIRFNTYWGIDNHIYIIYIQHFFTLKIKSTELNMANAALYIFQLIFLLIFHTYIFGVEGKISVFKWLI